MYSWQSVHLCHHGCYVDELLLLCPRIRGPQKTISIRSEFATEYGVPLKRSKTACLAFGSRHVCSDLHLCRNVSLRLMTSQFKDIATQTQKLQIVKCIFCGVWVQNFVWNFIGALWNFTQNFESIYGKICISRGVKYLTTYDILYLWHLKS